MIGVWSIADADRRLIPSGGIKGPVPLLFAIMLFIMVIAAGAGLAFANLASQVASSVQHRYSLQINDGQAQVPTVLAALRKAPDVLRAKPVPEAELRRSLERWLGPASKDPGLPIPAIIDVDLKPGADPAPLTRLIERSIPNAVFRANAETLTPLLRSLHRLSWLALILVILVGLAASAAVVMAARGALDSHRGTIDVMHGIGATDRQIARLFLRQITGEALLGGLIGTVTAVAVGAMLIAGSNPASLMAGSSLLGWKDALIVLLLPVAATLIAAFVARRALMTWLGDRL
nr:FtsX-like permease family protein [uncultured Sphingomonas sp.]